VLYDVFSVVVHLAPAPVVARVPTVLPRLVAADPHAQVEQQRRELAVAAWLAGEGHPVVAPSPLVPPEPVRRDGFWLTFWRYVQQVPDAAPDGARAAALTAGLHGRLRGYSAELGFLEPLGRFVPDGLDQLADRSGLLDSAGIERARREWALLEPLVSRDGFAAAFPAASVQVVHGDAPGYNLIATPDGVLCSDFEHITTGPVEWDLAFTGPEACAAYDDAASRLGMRPLDPALLRVMEALRMLEIVACLAMVPQLPMLQEGLRPSLEQWRTTPLAGGLGGAG
jgi:hypothetical protein